MQNNASRTTTIFSLVLMLTLPGVASAQARGHHFTGGDRTAVVPGYSYWGYGWEWGDPFWSDPFWAYTPYYPIDTRGRVKIKDADKSDQVYVNGSFAGTVNKMKNLRLNPGTYDIQISREGRQLINRNVYIMSGKTVHIDVNG